MDQNRSGRGGPIAVVVILLAVLIVVILVNANNNKAPKWRPGPPAPTKQVDEQAVYNYYNDLIMSTDNPAAGEIGNDVAVWRAKCKAYEDGCLQKTASHFGITQERVKEIFAKYLFD